MSNIVKTECAECFIAVKVDLDRGTVTARIPSNGKRGALYVAPHDKTVEGVDDGTLLLWECPNCDYSDSTYLDAQMRRELA